MADILQNTQNAEKSKRKSAYWNLQMHDPDGYWQGLAKDAIQNNRHLLHPDEQTTTGFLRFLLKNARQCVQAIRPEGV